MNQQQQINQLLQNKNKYLGAKNLYFMKFCNKKQVKQRKNNLDKTL